MGHRVYISASTQSQNVGVGQYGTEQDRMMFLANRIKYWLETQTGKFVVFRNQPGWTLQQTINDANTKDCSLLIDNHTNAGPSGADGTEVYYHGSETMSKRLAQCLYDQIAPLSPGTDQGVMSDTVLYASGLGVLRETSKIPARALIEHIFHSNLREVTQYLSNTDLYAKKEAIAVCNFVGEKWVEPINKDLTIDKLVTDMFTKGLVTDKTYWSDVLKGKSPAKPEYLQILLTRAVSKIP